MPAIKEWVADVFARGGELYCPRGRPAIWPRTVATAEDKVFMRANRDALMALVQHGEQPRLPDDIPAEVEAFARDLLARGIRFTLRNGRLWVQPATVYQHLSAAEKDFVRAHRDALKTLAHAGTLPEATIEWNPAPTPRPTPRVNDTDAFCRYGCGDSQDCERLKATRLSTWRALHYADPVEAARRCQEATAHMTESLRRGTPSRE